MRRLNVVRERKSDNWTAYAWFVVEDSVKEPEVALRNAVKDFLKSDKGKKSIQYACGDFNWGDAIANITDEFLHPHGLQWSDEAETIVVNQDEILFPDIQEAVLDSER